MSLFDNIPSSVPSIINMTETKLNNQTFNESNLDVWMNDLPGTGMRNTQQLNVDWEDFSNHCFFNSAEAKVNLAFDTIINQYPFDGTTEERLYFKNDIDGYTAWILNKITKNLGFLTFDGTQSITIKDLTGYLTPTLARDPGKTLLTKNIDSKGCTLEFWFKIENFDQNDPDNQIIFQKYENNAGITCYKTHQQIDSVWKHYINLIISSDEFKSISTQIEVSENTWQHVAFVFNQTTTNNILSYLDGNVVNTSEQRTYIDNIVLGNKPLTIATGVIHDCLATTMTGSANQLTHFSLDELRFWTIARSAEHISKYKNTNVPAEENLKLYLKFNEPSYGDEIAYPSHVVLDSSGNAFHSLIDGYNSNMRTGTDNKDDWHIVLESLETNPVLFPNYPTTLALNEELLLLGNHYDRNNPNLITKLVPPHYFKEAQFFEGIAKNLEDPEGIDFKNVTTPFPGQAELPPRVLLMSFLMVWAQFYDEIKLWIDSFSSLNKVDYKGFDQIPDHILMFMAKYYGIELPNAYKNENISKYNFGINLDNQNSLSTSLENINNQIWKRLLINLPSLWRSRGTINGLKALFNTLAIELDTVFEFKEFGGNLDNILRNSLESTYKLQGFVKNSEIVSDTLKGWRHYNNGTSPTETGFFDNDFTIEVGLKITNKNDHNCFKILNLNTGFEFLSLQINVADDYFVPTLSLNDGAHTLVQSMDPILDPNNNWLISISRTQKLDNLNITLFDYDLSFGLVGTDITYKKSFKDTKIGPIDDYSFYSETNDIATIKVWTKKLTDKESLLHQQSLASVYVESGNKWIELYDSAGKSLVNSEETLYDATLDDNSWERLMVNIQNFDVLDTSTTGSYMLTDITGNENHFTVNADISSFYKKKIKQLVPSSNFLYNVSSNKVRVRSTLDSDIAEKNQIYFGELSALPQTINTDDRRFSIEASIVSALNKDILNVFSDVSDFNDYLGAPEQEYAVEYGFMKHFNDAYFQRMNGTINYKTIIEFQRWFNENFQDLVALFLPYTTDFLGINFVIESHLLERAKMQYQQGDIHVDIYDRVAVERVQAMQGIAKTH